MILCKTLPPHRLTVPRQVAEIDRTTPKMMNDQEPKEVEEGFNFIEGTDGCAALKNACLVPLSMLVHHL